MNRGKDFEVSFRKQLESSGFDVNRLADNTAGYMGGRNICDFITYVYPNIFYFELKSTKGNTLPFSNITDNQFTGLIEKEQVQGAGAGIVVWFIEKDKTFFVGAGALLSMKNQGLRSLHIDDLTERALCFEECRYFRVFEIKGTKKRVFFNYNMVQFKKDLERYMNYGK